MDPDISTWPAAFAALILFVAYTVRGIAGFGSGLIAIPLLALSFCREIFRLISALIGIETNWKLGLVNMMP